MKDQLIIFDTTMRDGEQSPGAAMTQDEKLRIARQLERLRVDVIEAGFAGREPWRLRGDPGGRRGRQGQHRCALARANDNDVRKRGRGGQGRQLAARVHTFIATSPIHMENKLRMEPTQVIEQAVRAVKLGARVHRRRRVLRRGRGALRHRFPLPHLRGR